MFLAIETATQQCSVAAGTGASVLVRTLDPKTRASALAEVVHQWVVQHGPPTGYAIDVGPGSFTGLRVGVAFLKGLARACPGPVVVLSSLEILAADMLERRPDASMAIPVLKASGSSVFAGGFVRAEDPVPAMTSELPMGLYETAELASRYGRWPEVCIAGEAAMQVWPTATGVVEDCEVPKATSLLRLAKTRLDRGEVVASSSVEPAYHQLSTAEAKRLTVSLANGR